MGVLWFVLGLVVGAAGLWLLLSRKSDERAAEIEKGFEAKLRHAQDDAFQADRAHQETKERLIALQLEHTALEKRIGEADAALAPARSKAAAAAEGRAVKPPVKGKGRAVAATSAAGAAAPAAPPRPGGTPAVAAAEPPRAPPHARRRRSGSRRSRPSWPSCRPARRRGLPF